MIWVVTVIKQFATSAGSKLALLYFLAVVGEDYF